MKRIIMFIVIAILIITSFMCGGITKANEPSIYDIVDIVDNGNTFLVIMEDGNIHEYVR